MAKCANFAFIFMEKKSTQKVLQKNHRSKSAPKQKNQLEFNNNHYKNSLGKAYEELPPPGILKHRPPADITSIGSQPDLHRLSCFSNNSSHLPQTHVIQVPSTCTLPRRSLSKENHSSKVRSPSNPPLHNFQPPPYSRHQPPEYFRKLKRPCLPPPPPRVPNRSSECQEIFDQKICVENPPANNFEEFDANAADLDSGFESMNNPSNNASEQGDNMPNVSKKLPHYYCANSNSVASESFPSKSTEDLLTASSVLRNNEANSHNFGCPQLFVKPLVHENENIILSSDSTYPENSNAYRNNTNFKDTLPACLMGRDECQEDIVLESYRGSSSTCRNTSVFQTFVQTNQVIDSTANNQKLCHGTDNQQQIKYFSDNQRFQYNEDNIHYQKYDSNDQHHIGGHSYPHCSNDVYKYNRENDKYGRIHENDGIAHSNVSIIDNARRINGDYKFCNDNNKSHVLIREKNNANFNGTSDDLVARDQLTLGNKRVQVEGETNRSVDGCEFGRNNTNANGMNASSTSSSWMEWTQQLNAYMAWVNSQLTKRPDKVLISELRRDFQSGTVFADLIEILAGEKVAGIVKEVETLHHRRENLDRVLQFMSNKNIKMTHITSKEIAEGNLKSIMRVILALAAHYKPQSVREGSAETNKKADNTLFAKQPNLTRSQFNDIQQVPGQKVVMHDIGVGPDTPLQTIDKTPKLLRRALTLPDENAVSVRQPLKRQPSLTNSHRPSSPHVPVYENIPRRGSFGSRWAYDSLRASHKFHWGSTGNSSTQNSIDYDDKSSSTQPYSLIGTSDDILSASFNSASSRCTSLNTSADYEMTTTKDSSCEFSAHLTPSKPAAFQFWQELQTHEKRENANQILPEDGEIENSFRYHTIHRMSGRRKLPQIPGRSSSSSSSHSRGNTPVAPSSSSPPGESNQNPDCKRENSTAPSTFILINNEEGSREPEGRSQNSSPATSLSRGPKYEPWRGLSDTEVSMDHIKNQIKDQRLLSRRNTLPHAMDSRREQMRKCEEDAFDEPSTPQLQDEVVRHIISRRNLENEKVELTRRVCLKDEIICDLRKQIIQKEKSLYHQKIEFDDALKNIQNGKPYRIKREESQPGRFQNREEFSIVREAITALRGSFRDTDSSQHTLDTLEQAISVLMEKTQLSSIVHEESNHNGNARSENKLTASKGPVESFTKVIYFTDRTVTPFMSTVNKRLGVVTLRDFKNLFDRSGCFRFHFKNHDPEYGLVKEEITNDDDILPGVDGKIIAWVEEDSE